MRHRRARAAIAAVAILAGSALGASGAPDAPRQETPAPLPRIVVAFANPAYTPPSAPGATGARYGGAGYRVSQGAQQQVRSIAAAYALREVVSWPIRALSLHCVVFEITDGRPVAQVLAALAKDRRVQLAQPLNEFRTLGTEAGGTEAGAAARPPYNDPLYDLQTNLTTLGIVRAHQRAQGSGVRIALIDTGVDAGHPDLAGRIVRIQSFIPARPPSGRLRHGTAMAGLIAAVANNHVGIVGIAPLARLEVFEACWQLRDDSDAAACNTFTLAKALAAALASGAPLVNLSIGGPADPLLTALIEHGLGRGVTFVAARPTSPGASAEEDGGFPSGIAGVIQAAGSEHPLPRGVLAAPAEHVLTLRPGARYDFESGSSVAAAEITGVIALLMSASATRLSSETVASLLSEPKIDANAALGRLDGLQSRRTVTATAAP
jgi:subtilisin family serine protease